MSICFSVIVSTSATIQSHCDNFSGSLENGKNKVILNIAVNVLYILACSGCNSQLREYTSKNSIY